MTCTSSFNLVVFNNQMMQKLFVPCVSQFVQLVNNIIDIGKYFTILYGLEDNISESVLRRDDGDFYLRRLAACLN
ncbi:hypothetical protein L1987_84155 [Smallanthus sonchifolius]|uniref:Uncharacterized protein n=1 Tax=Smallanthus sonchifolius TaxID=185202 RepID=A0ACB8YFE5_9ASTR|nr:hypothetical protein L1987_84155 [Smallanthus sonchifolius]